MKRKDMIESTEPDADGFWIYLKPGFHNGFDPLAPEHAIHEDTRREAYARLKEVVPCTCKECRS